MNHLKYEMRGDIMIIWNWFEHLGGFDRKGRVLLDISINYPSIEYLIPDDMHFIRGKAFTCMTPEGKCEIVGYNYDPQSGVFQALLEAERTMPKGTLDAGVVIRSITDCGGVAIWSCPFGKKGHYLSRKQYLKQLRLLLRTGLKGIEFDAGMYKDEIVEILMESALEYGLKVSKGSKIPGSGRKQQIEKARQRQAYSKKVYIRGGAENLKRMDVAR